jgi:hypothetical protein
MELKPRKEKAMDLADAVAAFEADYTVHDAMGFPVGDYDGPMDLARAPTGEKYICLTSGGIKKPGQPVASWFVFEEEAVTWWLAEARHYRIEVSGARHLYWRHRPSLVTASFVNVQQAAALQDDRLRDSLSVELRYVSSWLVLSDKDPAGKETGT